MRWLAFGAGFLLGALAQLAAIYLWGDRIVEAAIWLQS